MDRAFFAPEFDSSPQQQKSHFSATKDPRRRQTSPGRGETPASPGPAVSSVTSAREEKVTTAVQQLQQSAAVRTVVQQSSVSQSQQQLGVQLGGGGISTSTTNIVVRCEVSVSHGAVRADEGTLAGPIQ
eukprot:378113-Prorocentrum_minimum.AAC.2